MTSYPYVLAMTHTNIYPKPRTLDAKFRDPVRSAHDGCNSKRNPQYRQKLHGHLIWNFFLFLIKLIYTSFDRYKWNKSLILQKLIVNTRNILNIKIVPDFDIDLDHDMPIVTMSTRRVLYLITGSYLYLF